MLYPNDEYKIFDTQTLTATYAGSVSASVECRSDDKFSILVDYRAGATETSNICEVEISFSPDGTNWAPFGTWSNATQSDYTIIYFNVDQRADANDCSIINIESMGRWMRVRLKEEGVVTNAGTATVYLYRKNS